MTRCAILIAIFYSNKIYRENIKYNRTNILTNQKCFRIYVIYVSVHLINPLFRFVSVSIRILYYNDDKYSADTFREYIFRTKILFNPVYPRNPYSTLISRIVVLPLHETSSSLKPIALRSHGRYRKSSGAIMQLFNPITAVNYRLVAVSKAWTKKEEVDTFL